MLAFEHGVFFRKFVVNSGGMFKFAYKMFDFLKVGIDKTRDVLL